jgi:hypothetical protein
MFLGREKELESLERMYKKENIPNGRSLWSASNW